MKAQEVILKAMAGSLKWWEAAENYWGVRPDHEALAGTLRRGWLRRTIRPAQERLRVSIATEGSGDTIVIRFPRAKAHCVGGRNRRHGSHIAATGGQEKEGGGAGRI